MCIISLLLELRISLFLAGDHGVPDDEVLLHPGDDVYTFQKLQIQIWSTQKYLRFQFACRFRPLYRITLV